MLVLVLVVVVVSNTKFREILRLPVVLLLVLASKRCSWARPRSASADLTFDGCEPLRLAVAQSLSRSFAQRNSRRREPWPHLGREMSMLERPSSNPVSKARDFGTGNSSFVSRKSAASAKAPAQKGESAFLLERKAQWRKQVEHMGKDTFADHVNPTSRETGPNEHARLVHNAMNTQIGCVVVEFSFSWPLESMAWYLSLLLSLSFT